MRATEPAVQRRFKLFFICDACPLEWEEYAASVEDGAWCPSCDQLTRPYAGVDLREEVA